MWELYDELINGIPEGIEITNFFQNDSYTLIASENYVGGVVTNTLSCRPVDNRSIINDLKNLCFTNLKLKDVAALIKSWNFMEASIGAAALNAYYNNKNTIDSFVNTQTNIEIADISNPFIALEKNIQGKKIATIGHFWSKHVFKLNDCDFHIIEQSPKDGDFPESSSEYILPEMDYVFITGFTLINKTLPRLLELSKKANVIIIGPCSCLSDVLFKHGVSQIAGCILYDFDNLQKWSLTKKHKVLHDCGIDIRVGIGL